MLTPVYYNCIWEKVFLGYAHITQEEDLIRIMHELDQDITFTFDKDGNLQIMVHDFLKYLEE